MSDGSMEAYKNAPPPYDSVKGQVAPTGKTGELEMVIAQLETVHGRLGISTDATKMHADSLFGPVSETGHASDTNQVDTTTQVGRINNMIDRINAMITEYDYEASRYRCL